MRVIEQLDHANFYHIYNCGINGEQLFCKSADYERFLQCYEIYMKPVADTYSWCLMGNHFHLLVRIKEEKEIKTFFELQPQSGLKPPTGLKAPAATPSLSEGYEGGGNKE